MTESLKAEKDKGKSKQKQVSKISLSIHLIRYLGYDLDCLAPYAMSLAFLPEIPGFKDPAS